LVFDGESRGRNGDRGAKATSEAPERRSERPTIGLALGGGGARGFAHIGVIRTLLATASSQTSSVGTSIGAAIYLWLTCRGRFVPRFQSEAREANYLLVVSIGKITVDIQQRQVGVDRVLDRDGVDDEEGRHCGSHRRFVRRYQDVCP
jgi:hypothetical protein